MHTEHLPNVGFIRVVAGWLVAAAVTSGLILAFIGIGFTGDTPADGVYGVLLAVLIGFWVGGFFTGARALEAPILHGVAIGLVSIVVWTAANALTALTIGGAAWGDLSASATVFIILEQVVAAVLGAWMGYRWSFAGGEDA
ncbi:MAG TPA: hypothetical protein VJ957_06605 [Longimicrobiales bacterium]|nr:hypothetical protein [Longimicrobiales bacterium]